MLNLFAPTDGQLTPIEQVPDPVFNEKMLGDGMAIAPQSNLLSAPCDGKIININKGLHALVIQNGQTEILIHIGIETVNLKGKGFKALAKEGDTVQKGMPLIEFDRDFLAKNAPSNLVILVVTNPMEALLTKQAPHSVKSGTDLIFSVQTTGGAAEPAAASPALPKTISRTVKIPNENGLHARPAGRLVKTAEQFPFEIEASKKDQTVNAKSVVGIMSLGLSKGDGLTFAAYSDDVKSATAALETLVQAVESGLGESLEQTATDATTCQLATPCLCAENPQLAPGQPGVFKALTACAGIAQGHAFKLQTGDVAFEENGTNPAEETRHLTQVLDELTASIHKEIEAAKSDSTKEILKAHLGILKDPFLQKHADKFIAQGKSAAFSFNEAIRSSIDAIKRTQNRFLMERISDFKDLRKRVLLTLSGQTESAPQFPPDSIVLAEDLLPSDLAFFNENVKGVVLAYCSPTAHTAIMLRNMGVPALVSAGDCILGIAPNTRIVADADEGLIYVDPEEGQYKTLLEKINTATQQQNLERQQSSQPAVTTDGVRVIVGGNISNEKEALQAYQNGAESLGLVRTEFLFFQGTKAPSEERQYMLYQNIANAMHARPITLRTLDVGGDKPVEYIQIPPEENPIVGLRGVRNYAVNREVFLSQIRAMLRVTPPGTVRIMLPMVAFVSEIEEYRQIIETEKAKIGVKTPIEIGIMIEVPSAALMSAQFAAQADFFSIGTNDLTQYTLAIDRGHKTLSHLADALNPAVLMLIDRTCQGAKTHNRPVAVCGAMGSDPVAVPLLVGLGITELAVAGNSIAQIKALVRRLSQSHCREVAQKAMQLADAAAVRALVKQEFDI